MGKKSTGIDFSFVKSFEYLLNFCTTLLVIYGILLFDSLEIMVYGKGIVDTDFSSFLNLSAIPFFLLFLVTFGVIAASLSSLAYVGMFKLLISLPDKFESSVRSWLKFEPKTTKNSKIIGSLHDIALITENVFLLEYIEKEIKRIHNVKKNHFIIYSLLIAILLNFFVMILYDARTILGFIICLYKNNGLLFIKICLTLLLIPIILSIIIGILHSFIFDDNKIYFPDDKYNLLDKEMKLLLKKQ